MQRVSVLFLAVVLAAPPASAAVIYDAGGLAAGSSNGAWPSRTTGASFLMRFNLDQTAEVDGLSIWAYGPLATAVQDVTVRLRADAGGAPEAVNLAELTRPGLDEVSVIPNNYRVIRVNFAPILLNPGAYWIGMSGSSDLGQISYSNGGQVDPPYQHRLEGEALAGTPEVYDLPFQVFGTLLLPFNPVPEPDTWALMIAGFGLAGAGLRRARSLGAA